MADALPGIKSQQNNAQLGPSLYNALSATSGGFLNQSTQRPTVGPPASAGVGPASGGPMSPMSPNGNNMFAPMSEPLGLSPGYQSNPLVTQDTRALNQQPNPQPNLSPTMPGQYDSYGSPAMPSPERENSPNMPGQSLYRSIQPQVYQQKQFIGGEK